MPPVELAFDSPESLRAALEDIRRTARVTPDHPVAGTVTVRVRFGAHTLELMGIGRERFVLLTDEPSDLRYQTERFLDAVGLAGGEPVAAPSNGRAESPAAVPPIVQDAGAAPESSLPGADEPEGAGSEAGEADEAEVEALRREYQGKDPIVQELKRIQALPVPQKLRLAQDGDLMQRNLLMRMYGKMVFEALLHNRASPRPRWRSWRNWRPSPRTC